MNQHSPRPDVEVAQVDIAGGRSRPPGGAEASRSRNRSFVAGAGLLGTGFEVVASLRLWGCGRWLVGKPQSLRRNWTQIGWGLILALPCAGAEAAPAPIRDAEIVIYGGTAAGIAAGIQAKRMGREVVVIEPSSHVGGLTTGGLGQTDIGAKHVIGGIAREFYRGVRSHYLQAEVWKWQRREEYRDGGQTRTDSNEDTMWTFEPGAATAVLNAMIQTAGLTVIRNERLDRADGVTKNGARIVAIRFESGLEVRGRMFIDATYEGDLLAAAGVRYRVGRESNSEQGETLNGVQTDRYARTLADKLSLNAGNHQLADGIDPYRSPGDRTSGLLPGIREGGPGIEGAGDDGVQAYCYRMCLTDHPDNRVPFPRPADYDEINYELLLRHLETDPNARIWINSAMPNRKTDTNNGGGFSGDFIGGNHAYPEADYAQRAAIAAAHRSYQEGLYWTLANHPRVPAAVRAKVSAWGLPRDEFLESGNWTPQLYVREARRMVGQLVMTQHHCESRQIAADPVGMAAYGMDSHHVQRYVDANGFARNEGNVEAHGFQPYSVGRGAILPAENEAENLIVPVCLSATHIAYGSIRMEPVFMVLAQSAATLAVHALEEDRPPGQVDYERLKARLAADGQVLTLANALPVAEPK